MLRATLIALAAGAQSATALTCAPPDFGRSYAQADGSEDPYYLIHGRVFHHGNLPSDRDDPHELPPETTLVPARFEGVAMGRSGRSVPVDADIVLEVICIAHWCGNVGSGEVVLGFLRGDHVLSLGPCGGMVFTGPTDRMLRQAQRCLNGGSCDTATP